MIEDLKKDNEELKTRVSELEEMMQETRDKADTQRKNSKARTKNVSNQHPVVKASVNLAPVSSELTFSQELVHSMFWDLVGVDQALPEKKRYESLAGPLLNGHSYEDVENGDGTETRVWRPHWKEAVDKGVNPRFIRELVERIMTNEQVSVAYDE
jgi:hypothetical protein